MSWNIKTPGDYINGPLTVAGTATITGAATFNGTARFQAAGSNWMEFNVNVLASNQATGAFIRSVVTSAANPTYSWTGDTDTGLFNETANTIGFALGGTTAMTLNSTGLGIGVSPTNNLHVKGASGTTTIKIEASTDGALGFIGSASGMISGSPANNLAIRAENGLYLSGGGNATQFILNSSGNVGVGVTPNAGWQSSWKAIDIGLIGGLAYGFGETNVTSNVYRLNSGASKYKAAGSQATNYAQVSGAHIFYTAGVAANAGDAITFTQPMTLTATGSLLVGCTSAPNPGAATTANGFSLNGIGNDAYIAHKLDNSILAYFRRDGTDGSVFAFYKANSNVGTIAVTALATTYNTVSDYRLKESAKPLVGGLDRVNALKPSTYNWKANGSAGEGFLAHELAEVVPLAVTGDKDAVDADGKPAYQGVDMSRVVPILVAAIQELTARVQTLEAR
jgi:hypothetical protein